MEKKTSDVCEHVIGLYIKAYELIPVTFNKLKKEVEQRNSIRPVHDRINLGEYFNRKEVMNLIRFNYCPYCRERT